MAQLNKIYLTNRSQEKDLARILMDEQCSEVLSGVEITDLVSFFNLEGKYDHEFEILYQILIIVDLHQDKLRFYQNVSGSVEFAKQLQMLLKTLQSNKIAANDYLIDSDNTKQLDVQLLLQAIENLPTYQKALLSINEYPVFEHIYSHNYQTNNALELELLGKYPQYITQYSTPTIQLLETKNISEEVEWVIQDILKNNYPLEQVRISCDESSLPYLNILLQQYGLASESGKAEAIAQFMTLINQGYKQGHFEWSLLFSIFQLATENIHALVEYVNALNLPISEFVKPFDYFEDKKFRQLQNEAELIRKKLLPFYLELINFPANNYRTYVEKLYTFTCQFFDDTYTLINLRQKFQEIKNNYQQFFFEIVEYILKSYTFKIISKITITSKDDFCQKDYHYSLNNQNNTYLVNYSFSGLIDEDQASALGLPAIAIREKKAYEHALQAYQANKVLTLTYSSMDSKGKPLEKSYEIEKVYKIESEIVTPLLASNSRENLDYRYKINPLLAEKLFFDDKVLYGSITSLEKYSKCQYAYFLEKGLRIKKPQDYSFSPASIGMLLHASVKDFYEQKLDINDENALKQIISSHMLENGCFKFKSNIEEFAQVFLTRQLINSLKAYCQIEDIRAFTPVDFEVKINDFIVNCDVGKINFSGFIDRVDIYSDAFIVKDYKTGKAKFALSDFLRGTALQLVVYVSMLEEILGKQPIATYYVPLNNSVIKYTDYELIKRQLTKRDPVEVMQANYLFEGITFTDNDGLPNYITPQFSNKINDETKCYDWNLLKVAQTKVLQNLFINIQNGNIAANPLEGACLYCQFSTICRFIGTERKISKKFYKRVIDGEKTTRQEVKDKKDVLKAFIDGDLL